MHADKALAIVLILGSLALASDPPVERAKAKPSPATLAVYDVRDLVTESFSLESLAERGRRILGPGARIQALVDRGALVVNTTAEGQAKIRALLEELRRVRSRIVTVATKILRTRGPIAPMLPDGGTLFLTPAKALRLVTGLGEKARVVTSPTLSCWDGQRATISALTQVSYIGDFEVEVTTDGSAVANPIVATLDEGVTVSLKPVVSTDGKSVTLLVETTLCTVRRPIEKVEVLLGPGTKVSIQVPEQVRRSWRRALTMPLGGSALIDLGLVKEGTNERLAILLSADLTELAKDEAPVRKK